MNAVISEAYTFQPVLDLIGSLTPEQGQLALAIYRGIAKDGEVTPAALSEATGQPVADIVAWLDETFGVYRDDAGNVTGFWGLTAAPISHHQLIANGKTLYAWCAWDTLFLPALLEETFTVRSQCAQTGKPIELVVSPQAILSGPESDIRVSMLVPEASEFEKDVVASFCHYIYFFESPEAGRQWLRDKQNIEMITLEQAFELGVLKNKLQFNM